LPALIPAMERGHIDRGLFSACSAFVHGVLGYAEKVYDFRGFAEKGDYHLPNSRGKIPVSHAYYVILGRLYLTTVNTGDLFFAFNASIAISK
jgi:hypothetical protein